MFNYIVRRLLLLIPVLLFVAVFAFLATNIMPGDPITLILGDHPSEEAVVALNHKLGLDQPLPVRFIKWGANLLRGDLGDSIFLNEPVVTAILHRMEPTLTLAILSQLLAIIIGIPLGIIAAINHKKWLDQLAIFIALIGISLPSFWLALILIIILSVNLGWLPSFGYESIFTGGISALKYLVMPVLIYGFGGSAMLARMTRSTMLDVLGQDYIRTARSKGLSEKVIILKHALRNALIPVITSLSFSLAVLLAGTWIAETIFVIPGTGQLAIQAIARRDFPVIQGVLIFTAGIYVVVNLIVDISYAIINPRIKYR